MEIAIARLHPLIVHFPIALLVTGVGLDFLGLILRRPSLQRVALWNLALGTCGAAAAVATGLEAEEVAKHSFEIWKIMQLHKRLGITTLILGIMLTAGRLAKRDNLSPRLRWVSLVVMLAMAASVSIGGYLGGRLVYEFGVGSHVGASQ